MIGVDPAIVIGLGLVFLAFGIGVAAVFAFTRWPGEERGMTNHRGGGPGG